MVSGLPWTAAQVAVNQFTFFQYELRNIHLFLWWWTFTISSGQTNVTTAMISDSNYFSSSNNSKNTVTANSQINSCDCFVLANYQGDFYGKPYQECSKAFWDAVFPCLDLKKKRNATAIEFMCRRENVEMWGF